MTETTNKPVLVGMNNPYNSDPYFALYPMPRGCAGYNVYGMLMEALERRRSAYGDRPSISRLQYTKTFDRRNVLSARTWTKREARKQGRVLAKELCGRRVVVFGVQTLEALGLDCGWQGGVGTVLGRRWLELRTAQSALDASERRPHIEYWLAPHPSGRCREYNDPAMRERVGDLLLRLYDEAQPCA